VPKLYNQRMDAFANRKGGGELGTGLEGEGEGEGIGEDVEFKEARKELQGMERGGREG